MYFKLGEFELSKVRVRVMVLNSTFNNISVIAWSQFYWWRKPPTCHKY